MQIWRGEGILFLFFFFFMRQKLTDSLLSLISPWMRSGDVKVSVKHATSTIIELRCTKIGLIPSLYLWLAQWLWGSWFPAAPSGFSKTCSTEINRVGWPLGKQPLLVACGDGAASPQLTGSFFWFVSGGPWAPRAIVPVASWILLTKSAGSCGELPTTWPPPIHIPQPFLPPEIPQTLRAVPGL